VDGPRARPATDFRTEKKFDRREEDAVQQKITDRGAWLDWMEIGALDASEIEEALDIVARDMRDNPLTVAVFGDGPEQRRQRFRRFMGGAARALGWGPNMLVARGADGEIAGVCNMMPPGECLPSPSQQLRMLPSLLSNGPHAAGRTMRWLAVWTKRDPAERHWHLGPLVVDAHLQGTDLGSHMMQVFCAQMDAAHEDAYLETDKPENVSFYERFGFEIFGEQEVLGVTNYFMLRRAEGRHG
jgi:ribosomal protein S18 acetylase RimI-like enzyme